MNVNRFWFIVFLGLVAACSPGTKPETKIDPVSVAVGKVQHGECNRDDIRQRHGRLARMPLQTLSFLVSGKVLFVGPAKVIMSKKGRSWPPSTRPITGWTLAAAKKQAEQARVALSNAPRMSIGRMKMLYRLEKPGAERLRKIQGHAMIPPEQYQQAIAQEKLSRKRLADADLAAPVNGFISKRSHRARARRQHTGRPVFEIVQLDTGGGERRRTGNGYTSCENRAKGVYHVSCPAEAIFRRHRSHHQCLSRSGHEDLYDTHQRAQP